MKELFKKLFNESMIYGLSAIISSFISIFLIPLYTKVFDPSDYGIISMLLTTFALLNILIIFGLDGAAAVWFWDKETDEERKKTFTSWLGFLAFGGVIIFVLLVFFSTSLSKLYFDSEAYAFLFILLGINLTFSGFQKAANIWFRMLQKPFWAMFYSILLLLVTLSCNILFVLILKVGIKGVFYSQAIGSVVAFIFLLIFLKKWIVPSKFEIGRLNEMIKYAAPLVPATLMFWLMNTASIFFIKYFIKDTAEVGLFQIGANIANMLGLISWAFFQAWAAFALSVSKNANAKRVYSIVLEIFCVLGIFAALSLFLMSEDILLIFTNEKYLGAKYVIGLLAVNVVLQGIPTILSIANMLTKNNKSYAIAIIIGSVISVSGFILFIPIWGKEGAAIAMVLGNLFVPFYLGVKAQKLFHIPYKFFRIISLVVLQSLLFLTAKWLFDGIFIHIVSILIIGCFLIYVYWGVVIKFDFIKKIAPNILLPRHERRISSEVKG